MRNCNLILLSILLLACNTPPAKEGFVSLPVSLTGIDFNNHLENTSDLNILNYIYFYNGAGVAVADFNQDGWMDLYFTANQGPDQLYINQGGMKFLNSTAISGIQNQGGWTTGVTQVDVNNDGRLDIYVSKVGAYKSISGHNLLFINQGNTPDGIPIFKESSKAYGLDFMGFSTQAVFFDYDLDNDLDLFLLNHSVYPNRNYGSGKKREEKDYLSGDKLFQNQNGIYVDKSEQAGIFQGKIGYGLGVSVGDVNDDRYPDIYVGNDFFENDYLYINQKDGTFKEVISTENTIDHTTHYSMGNSMADLNNDGYPEIVSLDMLPEDLETYKTSGLEYSFPIYQQYLKNGYKPQFMQNTLQLNLGNQTFSEIAHMSGIAATEWSWAPLIADFDNDGWKDIYITNGIPGATNDMDYINFISNGEIQKQIDQDGNSEVLKFIEKIPSKKVVNYMYKNNGDLTFTDVTAHWTNREKSFSNGAAYADLDNDGDLDIVVNNTNGLAEILENKKLEGSYVQVKLNGPPKNTQGVGARVILLGKMNQCRELFVTQGYQSAVSNRLHFGLALEEEKVDLKVEWPDGKISYFENIEKDSLHTLDYADAKVIPAFESNLGIQSYRENKKTNISFIHKDYQTLDYNRQPIIPFPFSNEGPALLVGDFNGDTREDLVVSGAKGQQTALFIQDSNGSFESFQPDITSLHRLHEDTALELLDVEGDGDLDLLVASGGNEFKTGEKLFPRLYKFNAGEFLPAVYPFDSIAPNASAIKAVDVDGDGDQDVLLTSDISQTSFGNSGKHYLFLNDGEGNYEDQTEVWIPEINEIPSIKQIQWADWDNNGLVDLIVGGYWSPIQIFLNDGNRLILQKNTGLEPYLGWWNAVEVLDIDADGDLDILAGNWGLNTLFKASVKEPITLYLNDFDSNETVDPLVTHFMQGKETPFASKDEWSKQMPSLNKKYLSYHQFANASVNQIFGQEMLERSVKRKVTELRSCFFENVGGKFVKHSLPYYVQMSQINCILPIKSTQNSPTLIGFFGNNPNISTQLGEMSANKGFLIEYLGNGQFSNTPKEILGVPGMVQSGAIIEIAQEENIILGRNNSSVLIFQKSVPNEKN